MSRPPSNCSLSSHRPAARDKPITPGCRAEARIRITTDDVACLGAFRLTHIRPALGERSLLSVPTPTSGSTIGAARGLSTVLARTPDLSRAGQPVAALAPTL